jgi:hypothetical protein
MNTNIVAVLLYKEKINTRYDVIERNRLHYVKKGALDITVRHQKKASTWPKRQKIVVRLGIVSGFDIYKYSDNEQELFLLLYCT